MKFACLEGSIWFSQFYAVVSCFAFIRVHVSVAMNYLLLIKSPGLKIFLRISDLTFRKRNFFKIEIISVRHLLLKNVFSFFLFFQKTASGIGKLSGVTRLWLLMDTPFRKRFRFFVLVFQVTREPSLWNEFIIISSHLHGRSLGYNTCSERNC